MDQPTTLELVSCHEVDEVRYKCYNVNQKKNFW